MHRNKLFLVATAHLHHKFIIVSSALFLMASLFFVSQSIATTNARGVEITFIMDDVLSEQSIASSSAMQENIWFRIQQGYGIPNLLSQRTTKYEQYYAARPQYVEKMMARSQKYLFYVVEEVEKRGMPTEIALLPMIESAYNPKAYSRSHAVGIWQFVPKTGKYFGLEQNWWADHRRDVTASTQAALDYLQKLHGMFGNWELALAAYNAGEGTVSRAIARNEKAGLPTDYQSLRLPRETRDYVPKLQAVENIVTNPKQYGLNIDIIPNQAYFAEIDPPHQIDAKLAAKLAEISDEEFALLNPSYNRPVIASKHNTHKLLLPITAIDRFKANLASYDKPLLNWKIYRAKRGQNIAKIASQFGLASSRLRSINSLPKTKHIAKSVHLLVPSAQTNADNINVAKLAKQQTYLKAKRTKKRHVKHKIKRGETLSAVARKYGTSTKSLMRMNRLKSTKIKAGQIIKVSTKRSRSKTKRI